MVVVNAIPNAVKDVVSPLVMSYSASEVHCFIRSAEYGVLASMAITVLVRGQCWGVDLCNY